MNAYCFIVGSVDDVDEGLLGGEEELAEVVSQRVEVGK